MQFSKSGSLNQKEMKEKLVTAISHPRYALTIKT